jgi:hypothetical protein
MRTSHSVRQKGEKMKKALLILVALGFVIDASAQIAIRWDSQTYFALPGNSGSNDPADYIQEGAIHALIWSSTAAPGASFLEAGSPAGADEVVLFQGTAAAGSAGTFDYKSFAVIAEDADVGGLDINAGYVYSRIFEGSSITADSWYYQSQVNIGPGIVEYDNTVPSSVLVHTTSTGTPFPGPALDDTADPTYGAGMFQVVPEPSVMALLGFGGLVLAIRRRMTLA